SPSQPCLSPPGRFWVLENNGTDMRCSTYHPRCSLKPGNTPVAMNGMVAHDATSRKFRTSSCPRAGAMPRVRPPGRPMTHHLRDRLHGGGWLVVDAHATLWHSGVAWYVAGAGGMVKRPPPPAGGPATAELRAVVTRESTGDGPGGQAP